MIRSTQNESIISTKKHHSAEVGRGESIEWVANTASPGGLEKRDIDARTVGQTTTPSDAHNGVRE